MKYDIKPGYRQNYRRTFRSSGGRKRAFIAWIALIVLVITVGYMSYGLRKPAEEPSSKPVADEGKTPNAQKPPAPPAEKRMLRVTAITLNLRSSPDLERDNVIDQLHSKDEVEILKQEGEWFKVKTDDGREGYVFNSPRFVEEIK